MHTVDGFVVLFGVTLHAERIQFQAHIASIIGLKAGVLYRVLGMFLIEIGVTLHAHQPFRAVHGVGMIFRFDVQT